MAEDKVLQVRYTRCGKQFEKSIAWDGCDPVGSTLGCIVEEHNLANLISGQERAEFGGIRNLRKPINLLEHGIDVCSSLTRKSITGKKYPLIGLRMLNYVGVEIKEL